MVPYKFLKYSSSVKYVIGILTGILLSLYITLGDMDISNLLILHIVNMVCASTYLYLLQFLSSVSYNFSSTVHLHPWLGLFLDILLF